MLSVSTLVNQLSTMQQLAVETDLQSKVAYNSSTLSVFSSMLFGENRKEILASCVLDNNNYPIKERPIYQAVLDFYGLTPQSHRDQLLSEVYFAIHEETYENDAKKAKRLEQLFHELKSENLEQESADLLLALTKNSVGSPLHAVYEHLYNKYNEIELHNNKVYAAFEKLNEKLSDFLTHNLKDYTLRALVKAYKEIRTLHRENENNTSECLMNMSRLLLASYCGQVQLLREDQLSLNQLFETVKNQVELLPFGVERMFLQNIFDQTLKTAVAENLIEIQTLSLQKLTLNQAPNNYHNFGFEMFETTFISKPSKKEHLISNFMQKINTTTLTIKQNSVLSSSGQI